MKRFVRIAAGLGLILAGAAGRAEATEYIYTTIEYPGGDHTEAWGINGSGQIVGYYEAGSRVHAFTLNEGVYTSFDHPAAGAGGTIAGCVNNLGQIVGRYVVGNRARGYLRTGDEYIDLVPVADAPQSEPAGINDLGQAVGGYEGAGGAWHGFFYDGASYTTIDFPGETFTFLGGINNSGSIVGYHGYPPQGFLFENGAFTPVDVPEYGVANATDINELGEIVGITGPGPEERRAFVLSGGECSILHVPNSVETYALDINNLGRVAGAYEDAAGRWRGFLGTPIAAADFDQDGDVDAADLALWQGDYGLNANCDADDDGDTDGTDFLVWQRNLDSATPAISANAPVPEPAASILAMLAAVGIWRIGGFMRQGLVRA
jgi:uncharacterized membrane protein